MDADDLRAGDKLIEIDDSNSADNVPDDAVLRLAMHPKGGIIKIRKPEVAIGRQVVERGHQFAIREIASGAEDHNGARLRNGARGQTFAQWVWLGLIGGSVHGWKTTQIFAD